MKYIGSHVSAAGGASKAVLNATSRGCVGTFAFFLSSPRTWKSSPLKETEITLFKKMCAEHGFNPDKLLPHGNYLINPASGDEVIMKKSRELFLSELTKCSQLGIKLYNFHPGSAGSGDRREALSRLAESINIAHTSVPEVITVLENMSGQGNILCSTFEEMRTVIDGVHDKTRVRVCLDTCHLFAAGYDISTKLGLEETVQQFDTIVGWEYLVAFHLNDSKENCGQKRDRHENLGDGKIGWTPFDLLMKDKSMAEMIFITETPGSFVHSCAELTRLRNACV